MTFVTEYMTQLVRIDDIEATPGIVRTSRVASDSPFCSQCPSESRTQGYFFGGRQIPRCQGGATWQAHVRDVPTPVDREPFCQLPVVPDLLSRRTLGGLVVHALWLRNKANHIDAMIVYNCG